MASAVPFLDKGYYADAIVEHVEAMGGKAKAVIPPKRNRKVNVNTTKASTNSETVSNTASVNSSVSAVSPRAMKNQRHPSKLSSLSLAPGCTCNHM